MDKPKHKRNRTPRVIPPGTYNVKRVECKVRGAKTRRIVAIICHLE